MVFFTEVTLSASTLLQKSVQPCVKQTCKILSFQVFLKIMLVMSFKIGFLFLVPADLALDLLVKVETSSMTSHMLNLPHGWYPHPAAF